VFTGDPGRDDQRDRLLQDKLDISSSTARWSDMGVQKGSRRAAGWSRPPGLALARRIREGGERKRGWAWTDGARCTLSIRNIMAPSEETFAEMTRLRPVTVRPGKMASDLVRGICA